MDDCRAPLRRRVGVAAALLALPILTACGGSSSDDDGATATTTPSGGGAVEEYCEEVGRAQAETEGLLAADDPATLVANFRALAEALRAVTDVSPEEIREDQEHITSFAEDLATGLTERDPQTLEEFQVASGEVTAELQEEYGDLSEPRSRVESFRVENCGAQAGG